MVVIFLFEAEAEVLNWQKQLFQAFCKVGFIKNFAEFTENT